MRIARKWGATFLLVAMTAGMVLLLARARGVESGAPIGSPEAASPARQEDPVEAMIHGFVVSNSLDLGRWSVRATPLRFEPVPSVHMAEINSRGRFELPGLADMDYRVELVAEGAPPTVLARADYVRPGREELLLEVDPLQLVLFAKASASNE